MTPYSLGQVGVGGYARNHITALQTLQRSGLCRLIAVSDPFLPSHPTVARALEAQGITLHTDMDAMLAKETLDAVFIATPIQLHAPQILAALRAGLGVYLEKPPCATLAELDAMREAQANSTVRVGFQMQSSPALRWIKRELLAGRWGSINGVDSSIRWPRADAYYERSPWAAKWTADGAPVFDGPATNALSHVVFAALFLCGQNENQVGEPLRVRGSLRRARPIESYDSSFIEAEMPRGVRLRLLFTHASEKHDDAALWLDCEKARIRLDWGNSVRVEWRNGETESADFFHDNAVAAAGDFLQALGGERGLLPTLDDVRPYVLLTCGALQSSNGARDFSDVSSVGEGPNRIFTVAGLDEQMETFAADATHAPPLFDIENSPWIDAADVAPHLTI
ncbi:MAG TPA: Gfo/Idh/MocA family oxidoreductase [Abditibacteriaceae bacterium]|jgi:predicted dehydrogenase